MSTIKIHNVETNEVIERDMTAAEIKQSEKDGADWDALQAAKLAKEQAKADLLNKLGITEEEAKLLL